MFLSALADGNTQKAPAAAYTPQNKHRENIMAVVDTMNAFKRFEAALRAKFPEEAQSMGPLLHQGIEEMTKPANEGLESLDRAVVKTKGNRATIEVKGELGPIDLIRVGGSWKVDIASTGGLPPESEVAEMKKKAESWNRLVNDIQSGKIRTQSNSTRQGTR